jgi:predicted LPLAT superfamily acyltransferase
MSTHWTQRKERSNRFYLRFMRGAAIYLPRFILTPVLHLITLFFYLRSAQERNFSLSI